jgi:pimeloyl-ACP methyl ester carboxylesterase
VALDIRYARSGGVAIAYQIVGEGDSDLVYVPDYVSNLVFNWESRYYREFYERLAQSFRLILFDKRGTGLSDHGGQFAALETRMDDLRAVLDDAGSTRAVVFGAHEGCAMAALYAATYPERTRALVLFHPGSDVRHYDADVERDLARLRDGWGTRPYCDELLQEGCPTLYAREEDREWFANELRCGASPAVAYALNRAYVETDLGEVLPAVRAPALVLYRRATVGEEPALDVASHISDVRCVPVSGTDYFGIFLSPDIADEIERFVGGAQEPEVPESVLATVLFTDIVASTERAAELGDRAWRDLLQRHHALVRRELIRFRGEE